MDKQNQLSLGKKISLFAALIFLAYGCAWLQAYSLSKSYYEHAVEQVAQGNAVIALKGMNKLELRIEDEYLGGFQQVIETWDDSVVGYRPAFYYDALEQQSKILPTLTDSQLLEFIEIYVQLDISYVPEAAHELLMRAQREGNQKLASEMQEFLTNAFPDFAYQA